MLILTFFYELALEFGIKIGNYVHYSSIWRYTTTDLNYSLKVLSRAARERCETDEIRFLQALSLFYFKTVQNDSSKLTRHTKTEILLVKEEDGQGGIVIPC